MKSVSFDQVRECLQAIGIQKNDGLLVHSAVQFLGRPLGGIKMYYDAIFSIIGLDGTIAVPTFSFSFAKKKKFDPLTTPSEKMGVFSELIRNLPGARRTLHPMQSLAIIGKISQELSARDTASAFDPGSAIEEMYSRNFKILLLGADIRAVSVIHYSEQRANAPYRYWKEFPGEIKIDGEWRQRTYKMFARDLKIDAQLRIEPIQEELQKNDQWYSTDLNYGRIASCRMQDFIRVADKMLASDPWIFVSNFHPKNVEAGTR